MIVIFNIGNLKDENFYYLSKLEEDIEGILIYYGEDKIKLLTTNLYKKEIENKSINVVVFESVNNLFDHAYKLMERSKQVGINYDAINIELFHKLKKRLRNRMFNVSKKLREMRKIKKDYEIAKIKKAAEYTKEGIIEILNNLEEKITERELAALFYKFAIENGLDVAFKPIIAFGENTRTPHHNFSSRTLKKGDAILIDVGLRYKKYCSDLSVSLNFGKNKEYEKMYNKIKEILNSFEDIEEGTFIKDLYNQEIENMPHALGHGIGIEVHEDPIIYKNSNEKLEKNMVIALEPAIYKHIGIRLENDFVVDKKLRKIIDLEEVFEISEAFFI